MGHTNDCRYCKSEFVYKYPYRYWSKIAKLLYEKSVKRMSPMESITFMYDNRAFIIDTTGTGPGECNGYYSIELVEAFDQKTAKEKKCGQYDYHWPKKMPAIDRDLKMLQKISETDSNRELDIDVWDALGDPYGEKGDNHHHCSIVKISGDEHVKLWLEKVWSHD